MLRKKTMSCKYQNILGKPNEGPHKYRIFGLAAVDLGLTVAVVILITLAFHLNFFAVFIFAMLLAVVVHRYFCVNTTINKAIFGVVGPDNDAKNQ